MNVLKLNDDIIIKEESRVIDRTLNGLQIVLKAQPIFGASYTEEHKLVPTAFSIQINKESYPELWATHKDSGPDIFIEEVSLAYKDYLAENQKTREVLAERGDDVPTAEVLIEYWSPEKRAEMWVYIGTGLFAYLDTYTVEVASIGN